MTTTLTQATAAPTTAAPADTGPCGTVATDVAPVAAARTTATVTADAGLRSCDDAYRAPDGTPDRSPRHTISEVAATTGLTAHTLRWYERIGLLDPVDRTYSGQRRYSDGDLARLGFLGRLRLTGMSVADMLRYVELARLGEGTFAERRDLLVAHREEVRQRLADLHATLAVLDYKIDLYSRLPAGERKESA
jgi:DNA-binding transcriptional MerR regulator